MTLYEENNMATVEVYCKDCDCEYSLRGWVKRTWVPCINGSKSEEMDVGKKIVRKREMERWKCVL